MLCGFSKTREPPLEGSSHLSPSFQRLPEGETTKERWHELCREATAGNALNGVR